MGDKRTCSRVGGERRLGRTSYGEAYRHEEPDEVVDDLEHRPFLGAEKLPGPWGEHEGVPGGDGQGADEKVLVGRQVGRKLEGVWKKACIRSAVSSGGGRRGFWGRTDDVCHGCNGGRRRREGFSIEGEVVALLFDDRA